MNTTSCPSIGQHPSGSAGVPASVQDAVDRPRYFTTADLIESTDELGIAARKGRLARGVPAAWRTLLAAKTVVAALRALGEEKWAVRVEQCSTSFWTVGCPKGHTGTVVAAVTKRCGLSCCPTCTRIASRRLSRALLAEMKTLPQERGHRWRFATLSLQPRSTPKAAWDDIARVREKFMGFLKRINGGKHPPAVASIEFGAKGHPHLHVLYLGPFLVRDTVQRKLVEWTGGTVVDLPESEWVAQGKPTKRGQRYRTWTAQPPASGVGGDWYVDVREVKGGLRAGVSEVAKYLADPFGGAAGVTNAEQRQLVVTASRNSAALAVAGKNRQRIMGYGPLRGIVGRALGKKKKKKEEEDQQEGATAKECKPSGCCPHCGSELVVVQRLDKDALRYFNREWRPKQPAS